ncbi:unnamed protein product [Lepidochelys olivacea]
MTLTASLWLSVQAPGSGSAGSMPGPRTVQSPAPSGHWAVGADPTPRSWEHLGACQGPALYRARLPQGTGLWARIPPHAAGSMPGPRTVQSPAPSGHWAVGADPTPHSWEHARAPHCTEPGSLRALGCGRGSHPTQLGACQGPALYRARLPQGTGLWARIPPRSAGSLLSMVCSAAAPGPCCICGASGSFLPMPQCWSVSSQGPSEVLSTGMKGPVTQTAKTPPFNGRRAPGGPAILHPPHSF